jgi:superfamily I DNA/RNA helicase
MHLAKGLAIEAVVLLACDDDVLRPYKRIDMASKAALEELGETERHLLSVAKTCARDRLLIAGVRPESELLDDRRCFGSVALRHHSHASRESATKRDPQRNYKLPSGCQSN